MACYAMALANKGALHQPHAVRAILNRSRNTVDTVFYATRRIDVDPKAWDIVREGMRRVVQEPGGTGGLARIRGVQSAGKTGTAQNPHGEDHAWFVGFAPFEEPGIALAVLVENAGFGGSAAAPLAAKVMEHYLRAKGNIPPLPQPRPPVVAATLASGDTTVAGLEQR
jgi:penicillin-binding protein 2